MEPENNETNTPEQRERKEYTKLVGLEQKSEPHDPEKAKSQRQSERIKVIRLAIIYCLIGVGLLIALMFIDLVFFTGGEMGQSPLFLSITGILGALLATSLGAIVGSSIN